MPNRILREGILTSPNVARLGWAEEVFYRRLMSVVDDFGRYFGDPGMLRAACYPRQLGKVSDSDVGKWLRSCVDADLVRVYQAADRESYVELIKFGQQVRAKKSKYPDALSLDSNCEQTKSNAHLDVSVSVSVSEDDKARSRVQPPDGVSDSVWKDFQQIHKAKKSPITETALDGIRREAAKAGLTLEQAIKTCCERGWQGFRADWMTDKNAKPNPATTTPLNPASIFQPERKLTPEELAANREIAKRTLEALGHRKGTMQ